MPGVEERAEVGKLKVASFKKEDEEEVSINSEDERSDISNPLELRFGGDFLVLDLKGNLTIILLFVDEEVPEVSKYEVDVSICKDEEVCSSGPGVEDNFWSRHIWR